MASWLDTLKRQILGEDRTLTWEGATGLMRFAGTPSVDRLLDDAVRLCKGALDRSTRSLIDRERLQPVANRLDVHLLIAGHDRAVAVQDALDGMDLQGELSAALTDYAVNQQQYLVYGGRVHVSPITVEEQTLSAGDEIQVRWRREKDAAPATPAKTAAPGPRKSREERAAANQPADPSVKSSGRKTVHAGEGISQPFTLRVKDREGEAVSYPVMTPFYFGRNTRGLQFEFDFTGEEMISGEHFSILYLPDLGYVLRDNKSTNGTMVVRGEEAVRLYTPPARRETELAKEMRLKEGDVIRLERGAHAKRGAVQFAFMLDDTPESALMWADHLAARGIQWRDARELVAQRLTENASPTALHEEYTLMIGESYLGASVTGSIWVAYREADENFRGGRALAQVTNLSRCTLTWLREDIPATLNEQPLAVGVATPVPGGGVLAFGAQHADFGGNGIPPTRVRFQWIEGHGRAAA
ncbi:MAG: FHA domain-containing protein [Armatimonadetes bacterium]|nr:FHA domain-containing protein [Armatimonadota bacterium]